MKSFTTLITMRYSAILLLCVFALASSCRKEITPTNQTGTGIAGNFSQVFEDFWNAMNTNYVFWSIDTTNWDNMHAIYAPKFARLNLNDSLDNTTAKNYFQQMVDGLIDSHFTLSGNFGGFSIQPAWDRKLSNPAFIYNQVSFTNFYYANNQHSHYGFYYNYTFDTAYFDKGNRFVVDTVSDSNNPFAILTGTIKTGSIQYLGFNSFQLTAEFRKNLAVRTVLNNFFQAINASSIKGLLIDLRGNGGGLVDDLNFLVGGLINQPLAFGQTRSKNGTGRLDYNAWAPAIVQPTAGATAFTKPIVVLVDGLSVSMSEITTMALKTLPNTTVVGDTTWGANGPLTENADFNAGSFNYGKAGTDIQSGTVYYYGNAFTSSTMFKYKNDIIYEGKGFSPDVEVKLTSTTYPWKMNGTQYGHDLQLEKALSLF